MKYYWYKSKDNKYDLKVINERGELVWYGSYLDEDDFNKVLLILGSDKAAILNLQNTRHGFDVLCKIRLYEKERIELI